MTLRTLLLLPWMLASCAETHSVAVFTPVADVEPRTPISAAIKTGSVIPFDDAIVNPNGEVRDETGVVARLEPTDLVVVVARDGDRIGSVAVERGPGGRAAKASGLVLAACGVAAAPFLLICGGDAGCATAGLFMGAVSMVLGFALYEIGVHSPLVIHDQRALPTQRVQVDLRDFSLRF